MQTERLAQIVCFPRWGLTNVELWLWFPKLAMHCFEVVHRDEGVWVVFAEYSLAGGQGLLVQRVSARSPSSLRRRLTPSGG